KKRKCMNSHLNRDGSLLRSCLIGVVAACLVALVCVSIGPKQAVSVFDLTLWQQFWRGEALSTDARILFQIRFPRVLLGFLVGGSLSLAGLLFQSLLQNPLADPFIIGVSGGSALAAVLAQTLLGLHDPLLIVLIAFGGGLAATVFVHLVALRAGTLHRGVIILTGVVMNAFFSAAISLTLLLAGRDMPRIFAWLMGSLNLPEPTLLLPMFTLALVVMAVVFACAHPLNLLSLGDFQAYHLGLAPERMKWLVLAAASLLTSIAVSLSGMIGFIGMFVPHAVRLTLGFDHRFLIPWSFLAGAMVLAGADTLVRLAPTGEVPVGTVMAFLGAPVFLHILFHRVSRVSWQES
ncbi:MAG TPA: iron ABC transporter permease, partial [Candidatus Ozemobacteraceae bacterium]|nr:iron ABC transporter permease [Candidatus Ozemobacteraceae bacterium]